MTFMVPPAPGDVLVRQNPDGSFVARYRPRIRMLAGVAYLSPVDWQRMSEAGEIEWHLKRLVFLWKGVVVKMGS